MKKPFFFLLFLAVLTSCNPSGSQTQSVPTLRPQTFNCKATDTGFCWPTGVDFGEDKTSPWLADSCGENDGYIVDDRYHIGWDISSADFNDDVFAISDGEIIKVNESSSWGEGNTGVFVKHKLRDGREFLALYGHVKLKVGLLEQFKKDNRLSVLAGESFATVGSYSGGDHLHFGIVDGTTVPPTNTTLGKGWGMMPCPNNGDYNSFTDPYAWITTKSPLVGSVLGATAVSEENPTPTAPIPVPGATPIRNLTQTPVSYELPSLDRNDYYSVLQWIKYAMANNDVSVFEELTPGDLTQLIDAVNAYAVLKRPDFLSGLSQRLPNMPQCEFYILSDKRLTVQTNSWSPQWEMKEFCHLDCSPMNPPIRNSSIVLSLELSENGWEIDVMGFNGDPSLDYPLGRLYPDGERISCDSVSISSTIIPTPVPVSIELDQSDLSSVLQLLTYAIDKRDLTLIEPVIGNDGVGIAIYGSEFDRVGYDNSDEFIPRLSKALGNSNLVCLGYDNSPNYSAQIFLKGDVDWTQFPQKTNVDSNGIVFGFVKTQQKWELLYVTKLPSYVLSYSHDYDCSIISSSPPTASLAPLNRTEYFSVLQWIKYAALNSDISVFENLIVGNSIQLIDGSNAAVNIDKADFLSELSTRLTSKPNCEFFMFEESGRLVVRINDWSLGWGVNGDSIVYLILEQKNNQWALTSIIYGDHLPSWAQGLERISFDTISLSAGITTEPVCKEARPTRLKIGDFAFISFYPPLNQRVRSGAGTSNSILDVIPVGSAVKILDGPECADNWVWWKVRVLSSKLEGWTSEGDKDAYWLIPCESREGCGTQ